MWLRKQLANMVTGLRIVCSVWLLFLPVFSPGFYGLYLVCGMTDMVDGTIARMTGAVSDAGARLDTLADILFAAAASVRMLPQFQLPEWLWTWAAVIAVIKLLNLLRGIWKRKRLPSLHTLGNKITGLCLFLLPLTMQVIDLRYSVPAVCILATASAVQEGYFISRNRDVIS